MERNPTTSAQEPGPPFAKARAVLLRVPSWLPIGVLVIGAVVLHSSFGRPLWIDEFLHFALGSHRSTREAWDTIYATTVTVNHGQTGVYMLIDYWLLQVFGASPLALRLPSLASALLLLGGAIALLRVRGLGLSWQLLVIAALFSNATLMYFAGEARPYMPLAAASTGALAYYMMPTPVRARPSVRILGYASIVWGSLIHPYFSLYWLATCLFAYGLALAERNVGLGWRSLLAHVNVPLCVLGGALYFAIGALTWLRGGPSFTLDPFEWVKRDRLVNEFLGVSHTNFMADRSGVLLLSFAATPVVVLLAPRRWRQRLRPLLPPSLLLVLALALSVVIGWLSYRRNYWILPRQWVASMALAAVAVVWLWGEIARAAARVRRALGLTVLVLAIASIAPRAGQVFVDRIRSLRADLAQRLGPTGELPPPPAAPIPSDNDGWVALANANVRAGGPVWNVFRRYYGK